MNVEEKHRERETELEIAYLPILMEGNVSKLFTSDCFSVNQIAGAWKTFEIDLSRTYLYDAHTITNDFIDYWEERQKESPPKKKKEEGSRPPVSVKNLRNLLEFFTDVNAYVSFKIMDAKLEKMRFCDHRVLAQAIVWKSNRINDGCIYQCLGKAIKEHGDKFNPETAAEFTEAVVAQLKESWLEIAAPQFASLREMLVKTITSASVPLS